MRRDTKVLLPLVAAIPATVLAAAALCSYAIARGASMSWRLLFRMTCHGIPARCLELWGVPMPVCARCTGVYAGLLGGALLFPLLPAVRERVMRFVLFASAMPMAVDGLTQLTGLRESTNPLRIATGLAVGMAFGIWVLCAVERSGESIVTTS